MIGLFTGCKAQFTLPPILGVILAFVGWGIVKPIIEALKKPKEKTNSLCHSSSDEYEFISDQKPPGKI